MKKIIILFILLLTGCSNNLYDEYVNLLKNTNNFSEELPFDINFYIDSVNEERIIYQVIIDNSKINLTDVKALVIHDAYTTDIYPSIGILDDTTSLNEDNKGIILIGYANKTKDINFKVLVETNNNKYFYSYNY